MSNFSMKIQLSEDEYNSIQAQLEGLKGVERRNYIAKALTSHHTLLEGQKYYMDKCDEYDKAHTKATNLL